MRLRILESSLNLRIEKGKTNSDYYLSKDVAKRQKQYADIDIYFNVEYMKCDDEKYFNEFLQDYNPITALFENQRGILCFVKKGIECETISKKDNPHFLHFRIAKDGELAEIIVFRTLVSNSTEEDVKDRGEQWKIVLNYIDTNIEDKSRLVILGDWNHGYIREKYVVGNTEYPQRFYNYQMIKEDLEIRNINMGINLKPNHKEHSYKGYLAIDHVAVGSLFRFFTRPEYSEYDKDAPVGLPDHAFLCVDITSI